MVKHEVAIKGHAQVKFDAIGLRHAFTEGREGVLGQASPHVCASCPSFIKGRQHSAQMPFFHRNIVGMLKAETLEAGA